MASSSYMMNFQTILVIITTICLVLLNLTSQTMSQPQTSSCRSQSQTLNTTFANCMSLPFLNANLHYTYNPSSRPNPSLSIAFIAPPTRPAGWVAWALNPTGTRMLGSQALVAFRDTNGSVVVRTYNISSYVLRESRISYEVVGLRGEYSNGVFRIFATLEIPGGVTEVNQVWQTGGAVANGVPASHEMTTEHMSSMGVLRLAGNGTSTAPAPVPMTGGGGGGSGVPTGRPGGNNGNNSGGERVYYGRVYGVLVILAVFVLGF